VIQPGLLSLYLRRGVARGEIVYGLSDIDLLIIINNSNSNEVRKRLVRRYKILSFFIPLFGDASREFAIYSKDEFILLYRDFPFYRGWFHEGKTTWRLLYGEDIVKTLPDMDHNQLAIAALEEFKVWWTHLIGNIVENSSLPLLNRKYLWYKVIAEAAKAYLFIVKNKKFYKRDEALIEIAPFLSAEEQNHISTIIRYKEHLLRKEQIEMTAFTNLYIRLMNESFNEVFGKNIIEDNNINLEFEKYNVVELSKYSNVLEQIEKLGLLIKSDDIPLQEILVFPKVEFYFDVIDNSDLNMLNIALISDNDISAKNIQKLCSHVNTVLGSTNNEPFIVIMKYEIALSLTIQNRLTCIKSKANDPIFFCMISNLHKQKEPQLKTSMLSDRCSFPSTLFKDKIARRNEIIDTALGGREVFRFNEKEFIEFFWSAARTRLLNRDIRNDTLFIPVSCNQINLILLERFNDHREWLSTLYSKYENLLTENDGEIYKLYPSMLNLLNKIK
jgi:predicted nucleotidyltransferase